MERAYRRQPVLVRNLLMAERLSQTARAPHFMLSFASVADLCRFDQRTKWLCPWGIEYVDETHRPALHSVPQHLLAKMYSCATRDVLSMRRVKNLIDKLDHRFERVLIEQPESFDWKANLHKHPVEELHIIYVRTPERYRYGLPYKAIAGIVSCQSLRVLEIENAVINEGHMHFLRQLKNLEVIIGAGFARDRVPLEIQVNAYDLFPKLTYVYFVCSMMHVLTAEEIAAMVAFVTSRRETLRHIALFMPPSADLFAALAQCPNLRTFRLDSYEALTDADLSDFLSHPHIRQNLQDISLATSTLRGDTFARLAAMPSLRWVNLSANQGLTSETLNAILRANRANLRDVRVANCHYLGPQVLEGIAQCVFLDRVNLYNIRELQEAAAEYIRTERPNFGGMILSFY